MTVSGNDFERSVGPITFVEIVPAAERTRSGSSKIFSKLGTIEARMATASSDLSTASVKVLRFSIE